MDVVKKRLPAAAAVSFFVVSMFLLFTPVTLYAGNTGEYNVSLIQILLLFLPIGLVAILLLSAPALLLPERLVPRYVALLFAIGLLVWIQADLLVWEYGLLDGRGFDWTSGSWRGLVDGAAWILVIVAAIVWWKPISKIAAFGSVTLLVLKAASVVLLSMSTPQLWADRSEQDVPETPPQAIFGFSTDRNVVQIIVDGFQSDIFAEIVAEDPLRWQEELEGFTFFADAMGVFPTTRMSVPALMSGRVYRNNVPMLDFIQGMSQGDTVPNMLFDAGYDVHLVPDNHWYYRKGRFTEYYHIRVPYGGSHQRYIRTKAAEMLDLVLFRIAPHHLKPLVVNGDAWRCRGFFGAEPGRDFASISNGAFLDDFIASATVDRSRPTFKYLHVMTTHGPPVLTEDCVFAGEKKRHIRENLIVQIRCGLEQVVRLLDRMRELGVYDHSLIIINADHGAGDATKNPVAIRHPEAARSRTGLSPKEFRGIVSSAAPLLLVKPPGAGGPLQTSTAPVAITDIPDTVSSALGLEPDFGGMDVFAVPEHEARRRPFHHYKWLQENWQSDYFERMDRFTVTGDLFDARSWQRHSPVYSPERYDTIFEIDFGKPSSAEYKLSGWGRDERSSNGQTFNWALGNTARLRLPLRSDRTILVTAVLCTADLGGLQEISVTLDGEVLGEWMLSTPWDYVNRSLFIDPVDGRPETSVLDFNFSRHAADENGKRPAAAAFASLRVGDLPAALRDN